MSVNRVLEAIEAIKQGQMIIMIDDEDRENEGDLVYAATFSTPQKVNFMATEAKGLICVAIEKKIAQNLDLNPMVPANTSNHETAFTVSIDATKATTGISAQERDLTIKLLADSATKPTDFVKPGHIFPLTAKDGGVLIRTGHTEGAVDICKLAGLTGAGVICEIMKEDGSMARRDDLELFAKKHNLKIVYIADLIEYRLQRESLIQIEEFENATFLNHKVKVAKVKDHRDRVHKIVTFGEIKNSSLVKFHNIGRDIDFLFCNEQYSGFLKAVDTLSKEGGVLIFMSVLSDDKDAQKDYGIGAQILHSLGIKEISLITTKKKKDFIGISGFGLEIKDELIYF